MLCDLMDCSTPGFLVHQPKLSQAHVCQVGDAIQPFHPLCSHSPPAFNLSQLQNLFQRISFFASGGQSIGASTSASALPMNNEDWFPLGLTGLSPCYPRDSQESSPTPQFKSINLWSSAFFIVQLSHPYMTTGKYGLLLEKWCLCFLIHYLGLS